MLSYNQIGVLWIMGGLMVAALICFGIYLWLDRDR